MLSEPQFSTREPQPHASIRLTVEQSKISESAPPLFGEVMGWLEEKGVAPAGAPFFNYTRMRGRTMDMEVGWPIASPVPGDGRITTGTLPGGRYAQVRYTGPYDGLHRAHMALHEWLATQPVPALDMEKGGLTLLEFYETDPNEEPDPGKWVTEIAFRLSD